MVFVPPAIFLAPLVSQFGLSFGRVVARATGELIDAILNDEEFREAIVTKVKTFVARHYDIDDGRIIGIPSARSKVISKLDSVTFKQHIVKTLFTKMLPDIVAIVDPDYSNVELNSYEDMIDPEKFITVSGDNHFPAFVVSQILDNDGGSEKHLDMFVDLDEAVEFFKNININIHMKGNVIKMTAYDPGYLPAHEDGVKMAFKRGVYPAGVLVMVANFSRQDSDIHDSELVFGYTERNNFSSMNLLTEEFKVAPRLEARLDYASRNKIISKYNGKVDSVKQKLGYITNDRGVKVLPTSYDMASLEGVILQMLQHFVSAGYKDLKEDSKLFDVLFPEGKSSGTLYKDNIVSDFKTAERFDYNLNGHSAAAKNYFKMGIQDPIADLIAKWRIIILDSVISNKYDARNMFKSSKNFSYKRTKWLTDLYSNRSSFNVLKPKGHENVPFLAEGVLEKVKDIVVDFIDDESGENSSWLKSWFSTETDDEIQKDQNDERAKKALVSADMSSYPINDIVNKLRS